MTPVIAILLLAVAAPAHADPQVACHSRPYDAPDMVALLDDLDPVFRAFPGFHPDRVASLRQICLADRLIGARGYYEVHDDRVVIARDLPRGLTQAVYVHELRHVQQHQVGMCPSLNLAMDEYARAVFAIEADASVTSVFVAWHLREAGQPDMWDALGAWPTQSDIATAFDTAMREDGDLTSAASRAFGQWYESPSRQDAYYVSACLDFLEQTERAHLLLAYDQLDPGFFHALCVLPDSSRYNCADRARPDHEAEPQ